ncbi:AraC family transcriptional regulator [Aestuariibacter salexigens]|uniref:AraC family transcriptional regulator n=1 Tax=Aestuariibacter salexigens TaxID=226010 RepID=UPI0004053638|nr:AraC family transcriptional regulator [Aestuariibacter salexigens]
MTDTTLTIPVHYLNQIANYLDSIGSSKERWLACVGLTYEDVVGNHKTLDFVHYRTLICDAIRLSGQPEIGLLVGRGLSINSHGMLGLALLNCSTPRQVLDFFSRYMATRTPLVKLDLEQCQGGLRVHLTECIPLEEIKQTFLEAVMMTLTKALHVVVDEPTIITHVRFDFPEPEYGPLYRSVFACEVEFNAPTTALDVPLAMLDMALPLADRHTLLQAQEFCEQELDRLQTVQSTSSDVKQILIAQREHMPGLQEVAKTLNMTPRTLHRRLQGEQTSFQQLTDEVRFSLAKEHLHYQRMPIKQLAYLLGYADVANFRRAFKRWSGLSPQEFRKNHSAQVEKKRG